MSRILLVGKRPLLERFADRDLERLAAAGWDRRGQLERAAKDHRESLATVRSQLAGETLCERVVDELREDDGADIDLAISVGGDGTLLAVHALLDGTPVIAVNSDPRRSVGHFTRCNAEGFADLWRCWQRGEHRVESLPRLCARVGNRHCTPFLNDCLFVNDNPSMITRYALEVDGEREEQYSSGVWVATGAGSTAAIASYDVPPADPHRPALLYRVREPFPGRGPFQLTAGEQDPPRGIKAIALVDGCSCYVDGGHGRSCALAPGEVLEVDASAPALQLVTLA